MLIDKNTIPDFDQWIIAATAGGERWVGLPYSPNYDEPPHNHLPGWLVLNPAFTVIGSWASNGDPKNPGIAGKTFAALPIEWIPSTQEVEILPTSIIRMSTLSDMDRKKFMHSVLQAMELVKQMKAAQSGLVLPSSGGGLVK